jgi:hypothetical protein
MTKVAVSRAFVAGLPYANVVEVVVEGKGSGCLRAGGLCTGC